MIYNTTSSVRTETADEWYHVGRCFYYLREAIQCHAVSALEWLDHVDSPEEVSPCQQGSGCCGHSDVLNNFVERHD